jgi:hypothetical protein
MLIKHVEGHKRSLKVKIIITLFLLLAVFQPIMASAAPIIDGKAEPKEKPGLIEKNLSKFVLSTANGLISLMKAQDVSVLVFQRSDVIDKNNTVFANNANATREDMVLGIFPSGLFDGIASFYNVFTDLIPIPIFVLLTLGGLFMLFDMIKSPENKTRAKEMILGLIVAALLLRFGHIAWEWIIDINYFIVDGIYVTLKAAGIHVTSFISTVWDPKSTDDVMKSPSFTSALLVVCALFMTFSLNYQYMMRMIILAMLIIMFPFVLISCIIPSRRSVLNTWFTQFVSQVFIQSAHAFGLGIFLFALAKADSISFWLVLTMFFAMPAMTDIVQRFVGEFTGEGGGGGFGRSMANASGASSLMAVGMMAKNLAGRQSKGKVGAQGNTDASISPSDGTPSNYDNTQPVNSFNKGTNEGVGSVPVSNGLGNTGRPRGIARAASSISKTGKKMANNPKLGKLSKLAAVGGMGMIGSMAGTMTTGNGTKGAMVGAGAGLGASSIGGTIKGKVGKGFQLGGEIAQSKAQDQGLFDLTKQRLGYHDRTQLSDPTEMRRMGEELLGGRLGSTLGQAAGQASYYGNLLGKNHSESANDSYETVNNKRDLDWSVNQQEQQIGHLNQAQKSAKNDYLLTQSTYGEGHLKTKQAKSTYEKANSNHLEGVRDLEQSKNAQSNFYAQRQEERRNKNLDAVKRHVRETQPLKNNVRSSGKP